MYSQDEDTLLIFYTVPQIYSYVLFLKSSTKFYAQHKTLAQMFLQTLMPNKIPLPVTEIEPLGQLIYISN